MSFYISTRPYSYLLFWPINSRVKIHLSAVSETATGPSSNGNHNQDPGCPLFHTRLRRLLPALKGCIIPKQLPRLHHPSSTRRAEA